VGHQIQVHIFGRIHLSFGPGMRFLIHNIISTGTWIINYNSKREDLEEEDQRQDERNVIL